MNIRSIATTLAILASLSGAAQAQTAGNGGNPTTPVATYTLRLSQTSAGTSVATLGSLNGPYRYSVVLQSQGCAGTTTGAPLLSAASLLDVSTTAETRVAELRIPLGSGSACALVGAFDLAAEDRPPVHTEPDSRGPGQGQMLMMIMITPPTDLTAADPVQLGSGVYAWGGSVSLSSADASSRANGICRFRYLYTTQNVGAGLSEFTGNTLNLDGADGPVLAVDPLAALAPGGSQIAAGTIGLPPGRSVIYVSVDALQLVDETSEANNLRRIEVNVRGSCG